MPPERSQAMMQQGGMHGPSWTIVIMAPTNTLQCTWLKACSWACPKALRKHFRHGEPPEPTPMASSNFNSFGCGCHLDGGCAFMALELRLGSFHSQFGRCSRHPRHSQPKFDSETCIEALDKEREGHEDHLPGARERRWAAD